MDAKRDNNGNLVAGGLLIILGLLFLAVTLGVFQLNWTNFWPIIPMAVGLYLLLLALTTHDLNRRGGLVIGGTIPFLIGLFFFATTLGVIEWDLQGRLWPTYPLIVGLAFFAAYLTSGFRRGYLIPAAILSLVGLGFLPFTFMDPNNDYVSKFWPVVLILVGLVLLIPGVWRATSHDTRSN